MTYHQIQTHIYTSEVEVRISVHSSISLAAGRRLKGHDHDHDLGVVMPARLDVQDFSGSAKILAGGGILAGNG